MTKEKSSNNLSPLALAREEMCEPGFAEDLAAKTDEGGNNRSRSPMESQAAEKLVATFGKK